MSDHFDLPEEPDLPESVPTPTHPAGANPAGASPAASARPGPALAGPDPVGGTVASTRAEEGAEVPSARNHGRHPFAILAILLSATFVQLVDVSIVNTAVPSIQRDLHATFGQIQLVLAVYQLAFACTLITGARLGDRVGRKKVFITAMGTFTLASLLCALAPNIETLILARVLQGVASGCMFPQVLSVLQATFTPKERPRALGLYGATIGVAAILGPVLGGAIIQWNLADTSWRGVFGVNLPIGIGAILAALRWLPDSRSPRPPRLDIPGAILLTASLGAIVYPLTEGRELGWPLWSILLMIAGGIGLVGFGILQHRETQAGGEPLVPTTLAADRTFLAGLGLNMVFFAGIPAFFFTTTLALQLGLGLSPLRAGLTTLPVAVASAIASGLSSKLARRLGRDVLSLGCILLALGMLALQFQVRGAHEHIHPLTLIPALLLAGAGLGMFVAPVIQTVLASIPPRSYGTASGVLSTMNQLGGSLGVAIVGIVFFGALSSGGAASARDAHAGLTRTLTRAGAPAGVQRGVLAQFDRCVTDRARAKDPSRVPPTCNITTLPGLQRGVSYPAGSAGSFLPQTYTPVYPSLQPALRRAGLEVRERQFARAWEHALTYDTLVFLLALGFVLLLPRTRREG